MPDIRQLSSEEWKLLRDVRLSALQESPRFFLGNYEKQSSHTEQYWRSEFSRGDWHVGVENGDVVSLIGVTREQGADPAEPFLEYVWVAPEHRRSGLATKMVTQILNLLTSDGVRAANLWVMDGNWAAVRFYRGLGFSTTTEVNKLKERPGRTEERYRKELRRPDL